MRTLAAAVSVVLLAACGSDAPPPAAKPTGPASTAVATAEAVKPLALPGASLTERVAAFLALPAAPDYQANTEAVAHLKAFAEGREIDDERRSEIALCEEQLLEEIKATGGEARARHATARDLLRQISASRK